MSNKRRAKGVVVAITLALVASAVAASGGTAALQTGTQAQETTQTQDTSYLRVVHASPDAPAVDVTLGNETVASNVSFAQATDYLSVEAGTHDLQISAAGDPTQVVFDGAVNLDPREVLTVAASGEVTEGANTTFEPVAFEDEPWTPSDDMAAVSVAHLVPDAGAVDVVVVDGPGAGTETQMGTATATEADVGETTETEVGTGTATETEAGVGTPTETEAGVGTATAAGDQDGETYLAENLTFRNATDYVNVPAGNYTLAIRPAGEDTTLATVDVELNGGEAYTAMAAGYLIPPDDTESEPFQVVSVEDASLTLQLPSDDEVSPTETETVGTETATDDGVETPTDDGTETVVGTETDTPTDGGVGTPTEDGTETETPTDDGVGTPTDEATETPVDGATETPTEVGVGTSTDEGTETSPVEGTETATDDGL
jgi:hypothetical protein